jgi:hypothetical protein
VIVHRVTELADTETVPKGTPPVMAATWTEMTMLFSAPTDTVLGLTVSVVAVTRGTTTKLTGAVVGRPGT